MSIRLSMYQYADLKLSGLLSVRNKSEVVWCCSVTARIDSPWMPPSIQDATYQCRSFVKYSQPSAVTSAEESQQLRFADGIQLRQGNRVIQFDFSLHIAFKLKSARSSGKGCFCRRRGVRGLRCVRGISNIIRPLTLTWYRHGTIKYSWRGSKAFTSPLSALISLFSSLLLFLTISRFQSFLFATLHHWRRIDCSLRAADGKDVGHHRDVTL